jgi:lipopolysaccharide/colanic/teichoic acid biosynthesis glycosyltransferase
MEALQHYLVEKNDDFINRGSDGLHSSIIISDHSINIFGEKSEFDSSAHLQLDLLLKKMNQLADDGNDLPESIIIDLDFNARKFKGFLKVFKSRSCFTGVRIFWNYSRLSVSEILFLIDSEMVDDLVDNLSDLQNLKTKTHFLNKYLHHVNAPNLLHSDNLVLPKYKEKYFILFKRVFDVAISLGLLLMLIPLFILVSLAIKLDSKGPVFYISKRVGRHYKIFSMFKFRSMIDGADKELSEISHLNIYSSPLHSASFLKIKDDPRVSGVGKFLRKTSIDEFPQLINVLMGHMSIVGNRPLPLYEAEKLLVNEYVGRFDAPAGITGLWQVVKKDNPNMSVEERIHLDIQYSNRSSFFDDLLILLRTPGALFQNQNY